MDSDKVREMIDRRYDEIKSGKVKPIDGEEAFALLRDKSQRRRKAKEDPEATQSPK